MTHLLKHLGGHRGITHVDLGTLTFLAETFGVKTLLDIGCGPGGVVEQARGMGIHATGIDGDPGCSPDVRHDFASGPLPLDKLPAETIDLIWSVEFLEHVKESWFLENVSPCFSLGRVIFITHALPGAGGYHHVNEQPEAYWNAKFADLGYQLDTDATGKVRQRSTMVRDFSRNTGKVYVRGDYMP